MARLSTKSGFTLLEMLVASLLLGMLVTILTMVFNSSAIAWRTGKAGVAQLSKIRRHLSYSQHRADGLLPRIDVNDPNKVGFVVSPWCTEKKNGGEYLRTRVVQDLTPTLEKLGFNKPNFNSLQSDAASFNSVTPWSQLKSMGSLDLGSAKSFTVGVLSYGPDGKRDTEDDISTWPDKVE